MDCGELLSEPRVMRSPRTPNGRLLLLTLCAVACSREPDLRLASNAELVKLIAQQKKAEPYDSLGNRAFRELATRPRTAVASELRFLLGSADADMRCTIAQLLGDCLSDMTESGLEGDARKEAETSLLALLEQPEERVRASALYGLGRGWSNRGPESVPQPVATSILGLIESESVAARFQAALAASWIGPAVGSVAEVLTTRLQTEPDSGVRFALARALGQVGANHAPAGAVLIGLLDDTDEKVRLSAVSSLAHLPHVAPDSIPRLRRCFADTSESTDVRSGAALVLVNLVTSPEDVERTLLALLDCESVFPDDLELRWLAALGTLGARAAKTGAAGAARERLEAMVLADMHNRALVATSSLGRIACAERDQILGERTAATLLAALPGVRSESEELLSSWASNDLCQPVLESLVDLALWPEMRVDATKLRPVFDALLKSKVWWTRDWAGKQLRRLK